MLETQTISLRLTTQLIERIDADAAQAGMNRTAYIVSWLPEAHPSGTDPREPAQQSRER